MEGNRKLETGNGKPPTANRKPQTANGPWREAPGPIGSVYAPPIGRRKWLTVQLATCVPWRSAVVSANRK